MEGIKSIIESMEQKRNSQKVFSNGWLVNIYKKLRYFFFVQSNDFLQLNLVARSFRILKKCLEM